MRPPRILTAALLAAGLTVTAGGCSVLGGSDGYRISVYFTKAPSLYEKSRVKIMGANAGVVEGVHIDGQRVRIDLRVDGHVPVPADARATITADSAIGERSVILYPAWKPGMGRAGPGAVIPAERTDPPVEIDEALGSFTALADSLDPDRLRGLVRTGAELLDGRGEGMNDALGDTAALAQTLASQDEQIVSVATGLRDLAASLNRRDTQLRSLIDAFSATGRQLADERTRLKNLLVGLEALIRKGQLIVVSYRETLPPTLAQASSLLMTMKANSAELGRAMTGMAGMTDAIADAWDRDKHVFVIRAQLSPTLRIWLQPIFTAMGWGRVPCLDGPVGDCPTEIERKGRP
ncbi:MCE family protein [Actinocorallia populi]|uniref:MCE family protein n=1 Tax=Actinocorallia populi TaxID=2079200 RepID=UPI000D08A1C2|nr:MCE family protein [Actinocorallia populi]